MRFYRVGLFLLQPLVAFSLLAHEVPFFFLPEKISHEALKAKLEKRSLDMTWGSGKESFLRFISKNEEIYFEICLKNLPKEMDEFIQEVKEHFVEIENNHYLFSYRLSSSLEEINQFMPSSYIKEAEDNKEGPYIVADRRIKENSHPLLMSYENLYEIIKQKKVLFYTGAGMSSAAGVPAMKELYTLLDLKEGEEFIFSLKQALDAPKEFASKIASFHKKCLYSAPMQTHFELANLTLYTKTRLLTENLDTLHEASGILPYRIYPFELKSDLTKFDLSQIDYIICIGLSFDDRGFLAWYKEQNPRGKIVSIDLNQPSYLGDEDYWLKGDLHA